MSRLFDRRQIRHAFGRAAGGYGEAAGLQHQVESWLLESLMYLDDRIPELVLDLGSGPATAAAAMRRRWPRARIVAVDIALPMLKQAPVRQGWGVLPWSPLQRPLDRVCGDIERLPIADGTVDVLFSNLALQWIEDLPAVFAGFRRVLKPGGLLLCSTFGSQTLQELHYAFGQADPEPHVSPFTDIARFGDQLMRAGFRDPVLDRELLRRDTPDLPALMRELRAIGATNALDQRRRGLTGRTRFALAQQAYEALRDPGSGLLPVSWEIITAMAWAPEAGAAIREHDGEIARFPADRIPVRRRRS